MKLQEFLKQTNQIKKGKFTKATWKSVKVVNGVNYEKVSNGVIRFVNYYNIKGVNSNGGKANPNVNTIVKDILTYNSNTKNYLVHMAPTNHHKPKCTYKINGVEVDKATYEKVIPSKSHGVIFQVNLDNLISLG